MQISPRIYCERAPLKGFFLYQKDGFIEIYFRGKRIRVFKNMGYIRIDPLINARRNIYHLYKKGKKRNLKKEHQFNTTFTSFEERKRREEK